MASTSTMTTPSLATRTTTIQTSAPTVSSRSLDTAARGVESSRQQWPTRLSRSCLWTLMMKVHSSRRMIWWAKSWPRPSIREQPQRRSPTSQRCQFLLRSISRWRLMVAWKTGAMGGNRTFLGTIVWMCAESSMDHSISQTITRMKTWEFSTQKRIEVLPIRKAKKSDRPSMISKWFLL